MPGRAGTVGLDKAADFLKIALPRSVGAVEISKVRLMPDRSPETPADDELRELLEAATPGPWWTEP